MISPSRIGVNNLEVWNSKRTLASTPSAPTSKIDGNFLPGLLFSYFAICAAQTPVVRHVGGLEELAVIGGGPTAPCMTVGAGTGTACRTSLRQ